MLRMGLAIALGLFVTLSCGQTGDSTGTGGSAGSAGQSSDGGNPCPLGQCLAEGGACVDASGPVGNALCVGPNGECSVCKCASPDTPIATPTGERRIADLEVGDLVYSVDHGSVRSVPIVLTGRTAVNRHSVVRAELATGATLEISPGHPTADGRTFADLRAGGRLDGVALVRVEIVPYRAKFTHDILPGSDSGSYFAGGVLIGSTLAHAVPASRADQQSDAR